jgi:RNA polymerase sigma-70 factor, ECF subfamily
VRPIGVSGTALARILAFPGRNESHPCHDIPGRPAAGAVSVDERAAKRERESDILTRVVAGDVDAFEYFVVTYQKRITRFVYTLLRDPADADGITQDIFVKAFRALPEFQGQSAFETWLTRIAINAVRDHIRRRKPVVYFSDLSSDPDDDCPELPAAFDPADGTSPERDLLSQDIRRRIAEALVALSPRQRAVFVMKHYEEKSIAEIGEATGLDEGTIKSHLFRAARKLRARLEDLR